jgi:MoxR-like ATPase
MFNKLHEVARQVSQIVVGKDLQVRQALTCLLAGGHLLVEDVPGVGKTTLAHALAISLGLKFNRVQFTSDLLPADVAGISVYERESNGFVFHPGPIFTQVLLADEINRATPKTQSGLLEAMEERQVSADGVTRALPEPFFVIATQNPRVDHGTFPLVAGQRDRFATRLRLGIPAPDVERALLRGTGGTDHLHDITAVASADTWRAEQAAAAAVHVDDAVLEYVLAIAGAVRSHPQGDPELSPRATRTMLRVAQARALLDGRGYVLPDDVKAVAPAVLDHRLPPSPGLDDTRAAAIVAAVPAPPFAP